MRKEILFLVTFVLMMICFEEYNCMQGGGSGGSGGSRRSRGNEEHGGNNEGNELQHLIDSLVNDYTRFRATLNFLQPHAQYVSNYKQFYRGITQYMNSLSTHINELGQRINHPNIFQPYIDQMNTINTQLAQFNRQYRGTSFDLNELLTQFEQNIADVIFSISKIRNLLNARGIQLNTFDDLYNDMEQIYNIVGQFRRTIGVQHLNLQGAESHVQGVNTIQYRGAQPNQQQGQNIEQNNIENFVNNLGNIQGYHDEYSNVVAYINGLIALIGEQNNRYPASNVNEQPLNNIVNQLGNSNLLQNGDFQRLIYNNLTQIENATNNLMVQLHPAIYYNSEISNQYQVLTIIHQNLEETRRMLNEIFGVGSSNTQTDPSRRNDGSGPSRRGN